MKSPNLRTFPLNTFVVRDSRLLGTILCLFISPLCISAIGSEGGRVDPGGSTYRMLELRCFVFILGANPLRSCQGCISICSSRLWGSVTTILKEDAATVAAEARCPIEPDKEFSTRIAIRKPFERTFAHAVLEVSILGG